MNQHVRFIVHWSAVFVFSSCIVMSLLLIYFGFIPEGVVNDFTNFLEKLLKKRESAFALFGAALTALPALSLRLAVSKSGGLTRRGRYYFFSLIAVCALSAFANILVEPGNDSAGGVELSVSAETASLGIFTYASTMLLAMLGFGKLPEKDGKND